MGSAGCLGWGGESQSLVMTMTGSMQDFQKVLILCPSFIIDPIRTITSPNTQDVCWGWGVRPYKEHNESI